MCGPIQSLCRELEKSREGSLKFGAAMLSAAPGTPDPNQKNESKSPTEGLQVGLSLGLATEEGKRIIAEALGGQPNDADKEILFLCLLDDLSFAHGSELFKMLGKRVSGDGLSRFLSNALSEAVKNLQDKGSYSTESVAKLVNDIAKKLEHRSDGPSTIAGFISTIAEFERIPVILQQMVDAQSGDHVLSGLMQRAKPTVLGDIVQTALSAKSPKEQTTIFAAMRNKASKARASIANKKKSAAENAAVVGPLASAIEGLTQAQRNQVRSGTASLAAN